MNRGLRPFNTFITQEFALGKASINLNSVCSNVHLLIPILSKDDICPLELSLIYNNNDGTNLSPKLGRGFVPSFYFNISKIGNAFTLIYPDGYSIEYSLENGLFVNTFDKSFIKVIDNQTYLYLENGEHYIFDINGSGDISGAYYIPSKIIDQYGNETNISRSASSISIDCYKNIIVNFNIVNNNITSIDIKSKNNHLIKSYSLVQSNGYLSTIILRKNNNNIETVSFGFSSYKLSSISSSTTEDNILFQYTDDKCTGITNSKSNNVYNILYNDDKTIVTNERNESTYYYFDNNHYLSLLLDNNGRFKTFVFNNKGKILQSSKTMLKDDHTSNIKNLLSNGNFASTGAINQSSSLWKSTNNKEYIPESDSNIPLNFANNTLLLTQYTSTYEGIYQDILLGGEEGDIYTLFALFKCESMTSTLNVEVHVYDGDELKETLVDSKTSLQLSKYCASLFTFKTKYKHTKLCVRLLNKGTKINFGNVSLDSKLYITAINFIKGSLEIDDLYNGALLSKSKKGNKVTNYSYYPQSNSSVVSVASIDSNTFNTTIDDRDSNGNFKEITVNNKISKALYRNEKGEIIESSLFYNDKCLNTYNIYSNDLLSRREDECGFITDYSYNQDLMINYTLFATHKTRYEYDNKGFNNKIIHSYNNNEVISKNFTYDSKYRLVDFSSSKNNLIDDKYSNTYNNFDLVSDVSNSISTPLSIEKYEYENITSSFPRYMAKKTYGTNYFSFHYDNNGELLNSIKYNGNDVYTFTYDNLNRLSSVINVSVDTISFNYDNLDNLVSTSDRELNTQYYYDNENNNYGYRHSVSSSVNHYYSLGSEYDALTNKELLLHELEKIDDVFVMTLNRYFDNPESEDNERSLKPYLYNYKNGLLNIIYGNNYGAVIDKETYGFNSLLIYPNSLVTKIMSINPIEQYSFYPTFTLGFFYSKLKTEASDILDISFTNNNYAYTIGHDSEGKIFVTLHLSAFESETQTTNFVLNSSLQHLRFEFNGETSKVDVYLNNTKETLTFNNGVPGNYIHSITFRNSKTHQNNNEPSGRLMFFYIGENGSVIDTSKIDKIDYLVKEIISKDIQNLSNNDLICKNKVFYPYNLILSSYSLFTFDGTFKSNNNQSLYYKDIDNNIPPFVYNDLLGQKVYFPTNDNKVIIKSNMTNQGCVVIRFKLNDLTSSGTIFELVSNMSSSFIKVFVDNGQLMVRNSSSLNNGNASSATINEGWNTLVFSYQYSAASGMWLSRVETHLYLNGVNESSSFIHSTSLNSRYVSIGNSFNEKNPLKGLIAEVAYKNSYVTTDTEFSSLVSALNDKLNFVSYYDPLSRLKDNKIMFSGLDFIKKTYEYSSLGTYKESFIRTSKLPASMVTSINSGSNRYCYLTYNTDSSISSLTTYSYVINNSYNFVYDNRNRLIDVTAYNHSAYSYEYDNKDNIIKIISGNTTHNLTYDSYNRLLTYDNITFEYNNSDPFIITKINNGNNTINLSYMGRRLTNYNKINNNIIFAYDYMGRRSSKTVNGVIKEYYYDGDILIASKKGDNVVYYLYDNHNQAIGFIRGSNYYFYIRDILGVIKEVIDKDGVVRYNYNYSPYGEVIPNSISNTNYYDWIKDVNDIVYKGYVYDVETGWYWLSSRYYSPELCRFISPDSVDYLDPSSINGLNLYAYCNNDPVNRFDPTGHSWESFWNGVGDWFSDNWVKLAIGAGAIALGVLTMGAATLISGAGMAAVLSAMGTAAVSSLIQVGISTAISAGIGFAVGGITSGSWEGAVDGMLNGIADGFMWGGIFAGAGQVLSGAMKITRTLAPNFNGAQIGRVKLWSPNAAGNPNTGGTLIKFGGFNRIDSEIGNMIHIHLKLLGRTINHFPIGMIAGGVIGGF